MNEEPQSPVGTEHATNGHVTVERPTWTITLPSGWARAALAGVEGALLGWAVPALVVVLVFLMDSANPWFESHYLEESARLGTDFWALTLGAPMVVDGLSLTLIPLTWSVLQVLLLRVLMVRGATHAPSSQWFAIPTFVLTAVIIVLAAPSNLSWTKIFPGVLILPTVAVVWAVASQSSPQRAWLTRVPWLRRGLKVGFGSVVAVFVFAVGAVVVAAAVSWSEIMDQTSLLTAGGSPVLPSLILLGFYLVTFGGWALAWLAGPGFVADGGAVHSPTEGATAVLAGVPVAPLIPTTTPGLAVVWLPVGLGLLLGIIIALRLAAEPAGEVVAVSVVSAVVLVAFIFLYLTLSGGALGEMRLSFLGPVPSAWWMLAIEVVVPALVLPIILNPQFVRAVINMVTGARTSLPGTDTPKGASGSSLTEQADGQESDRV